MSTINCLKNHKPISLLRATMLTFKRLSLILSDETKCDFVAKSTCLMNYSPVPGELFPTIG